MSDTEHPAIRAVREAFGATVRMARMHEVEESDFCAQERAEAEVLNLIEDRDHWKNSAVLHANELMEIHERLDAFPGKLIGYDGAVAALIEENKRLRVALNLQEPARRAEQIAETTENASLQSRIAQLEAALKKALETLTPERGFGAATARRILSEPPGRVP